MSVPSRLSLSTRPGLAQGSGSTSRPGRARVALSAIGVGRPEVAAAASPQRKPVQAFSRVVGSFVPKLTKKAFEKYGFSTAALLTDWAAIVGAELAKVTVPERLKWPRWVDVGGEVEPGAEGRPGATLLLKVDSARALDVEYRRGELIERVNAYFGYRAVAELKVVQVPAGSLMSQSGKPMLTPKAPVRAAAAAPEIDAIADDGLRAALARMQAAIASGKAG